MSYEMMVLMGFLLGETLYLDRVMIFILENAVSIYFHSSIKYSTTLQGKKN